MPDRRRYVTWNEVGREVQAAQWREALEATAGNITKAGEAMGFVKSWAMKLTRIHELNEYAAELRGQRRGRPKKKDPQRVSK